VDLAGHIINISSIAAHETYPDASIYSPSKHAVAAFTECLRHDLVATQVRRLEGSLSVEPALAGSVHHAYSWKLCTDEVLT
jgi:NADP-dependent 3-hydroxy acid dehydrogenase YdfG